jgi:enamine deaminase RidA (YjgF/YER057c/UK114 family)
MDLVALQHAGGAARPFRALHPELQCEAWSYGSAFSRGMEIDVSGRRLLTISGTASIGPDGASVHRDEPRAQILLALRNVESLLRRAGADGARGLWTLYFRDTGTWQAWRSLVSSGELLAPPRAAAIFAEICRPELAFEAEVTVPG